MPWSDGGYEASPEGVRQSKVDSLADRFAMMIGAPLRRVVTATEGHVVDVTVCGEMGGRSLEALALMGIGIKRLSITPAAIGPVKAMIRSSNHAAITAKMAELMASPPKNMRETLTGWAAEQQIEIG